MPPETCFPLIGCLACISGPFHAVGARCKSWAYLVEKISTSHGILAEGLLPCVVRRICSIVISHIGRCHLHMLTVNIYQKEIYNLHAMQLKLDAFIPFNPLGVNITFWSRKCIKHFHF
jgi:hypothetical protein